MSQKKIFEAILLAIAALLTAVQGIGTKETESDSNGE